MFAAIRHLLSRTSRLTLLQRFTVLGVFTTCLVATSVSLGLSQYLVQKELNNFGRAAATAVTAFLGVSEVAGEPSAFALSNTDRWQQLAQTLTENSNVVRVKVWGPTGQIIYSDEQALIGQTFSSDEFDKAVGGEVTQEVGEQDESDNAAEAQFGRLFEVYVPVRLPGTQKAIGVFEIYQRYEPIAAEIRELRYLVWGFSFGALGALFGALYLLVRRASEQLTQMAYSDSLTGLANRNLLFERIDRAISSSKQGKKSVGLLYLDLSRFKAVNDTLGHVAGDQLLQAIGTRLIKLVRPQDTVARVGGDEFVIVFPEVGPKEAALALAKRVQDGMGDAFEINGKILHIGSNIGLALYPENASDRDDLIYKADIAHYKTKQKSVGLGLYEGERPRYTAAELQLEEDLRAALAGEQLRLHYQPVAQLKDGQVVGVEALVRWCHPTKGFITPLDFIPLAEETGLIRDIDRWVLNEAVKQNACWAAQGIRLEVAVNVSPKSFSDSRFLDHLTQTLCTHSLDPSCLVLEITERLLVDVTNAQAALRQINTLGVKVALDDFGIGFSSLAYLENLPIDLLKVDRHFVKGINTAPASEAIIRTVISLAHNLGMEVVAEGIESEAQRLWLLQEGCDKAQGYLLGKPLPADKFLHSWYQLNTKAKAKNLQDRVLS